MAIFLRGATHDCDACHAALQHGPHSIAAWATPAFRRGPHAWHFLLPATRSTHGLATIVIATCGNFLARQNPFPRMIIHHATRNF